MLAAVAETVQVGSMLQEAQAMRLLSCAWVCMEEQGRWMPPLRGSCRAVRAGRERYVRARQTTADSMALDLQNPLVHWRGGWAP